MRGLAVLTQSLLKDYKVFKNRAFIIIIIIIAAVLGSYLRYQEKRHIDKKY